MMCSPYREQGQFSKRNTKRANAREKETMDETAMQKRRRGPRPKEAAEDEENIRQAS
jgi:hypothetical protein